MHALMDETLRALTEQVEAFCQQVIAPRAAEIDQSNAFPRDLWPQMGELGLHGITVAEEYDGVTPTSASTRSTATAPLIRRPAIYLIWSVASTWGRWP